MRRTFPAVSRNLVNPLGPCIDNRMEMWVWFMGLESKSLCYGEEGRWKFFSKRE